MYDKYFNTQHILGKISTQETDIFLIFFQKIGFGISCNLSPGDKLREISNPILLEKKIREDITECFTQHAEKIRFEISFKSSFC